MMIISLGVLYYIIVSGGFKSVLNQAYRSRAEDMGLSLRLLGLNLVLGFCTPASGG